ncbi:uncharacterized protein PAC_06407 [Phialocephala subalpina]|uniref:Uncharacterized protein n=1 Tax=Phialocephala subalpina TaxID=576137 RepID=A0A1L7WUS0_9HELO|nr:uncharacterized protein PAC_06407 [Phialocephala subalpina]
MPDSHPPAPKYTFLQCVIIFWFLMHRVDEHDHWLWLNALQGRTLGSQYQADNYKGWFFWMYLSGLNDNDMKVRFNLQGWCGYSPNSDGRWFGNRLTAWGWPMQPRGKKEAWRNFIGYLREIVPATELELQRDGYPKISQYITAPGWELLPTTNHPHEVSFTDLETQALALYNDKQALSPEDILNSYRLVNNPSSARSAIGQGHFGPALAESSGSTNVVTSRPRAPNPPSYSPQVAKEEMQVHEVPMAINRSNRPFVTSPDTDHQPIATNPVPRSRPPERRHKPPMVAKNNLNLTEGPSTPRGNSKRKVQSASSDSAKASRQHSVGLSTQTASGIGRVFPSTPQNGIKLLNQPTLGINNVEYPPRGPAMTNTGQRKPQPLSNFPSHPQEQVRQSLNYQHRQDSPPTIANSKLPLPSLPQVDDNRRLASTPKRRRVEAFSPASVNSSIVTSPSAWSPHSHSSFTSMASNTPSQIWSAKSSPLPNFDVAIPAQECSSLGIKGKGTEVPDRPSLMSPGSVIQAVNARLSEQLESPPKFSKSRPRSTLPPDTLPRRALKYADKAMDGANAEGNGETQDRAGIVNRAVPTKDVDISNVLLAAGEAISDVASDISSPERAGEDEEAWVAADAYNDGLYKLGVDYAPEMMNQRQAR